MLEIDDRRRPTNRDDMWSEWNLGQREPVGDYVEEEPWCVTEEVYGEGSRFFWFSWRRAAVFILALVGFSGW